MRNFRRRKSRMLKAAFCAIAICFARTGLLAQSTTNTNAPSVTYARDVLPILVGKCSACHTAEGKFLADWADYDTAYKKRLEIKRRVWDSWQGRYYKEPMPAGYSPQTLAMTVAERQTIKQWVDDGAVRGVAPTIPKAGSQAERIELGRRIFTVTCVPCHQADGRGVPERFPPLAGSDFLNADKNRAIKTVINGRSGEIVVNGRAYNNSMPKFPLTDGQIAEVLSFVYSAFGNSGQEVRPEEVKILRAQKDEPASAPAASRSTAAPNRFE